VADPYIDYGEVSEYGHYLANMLETLIGASSLVDVAAFKQLLLDAVDAVEREHRSAQLQHGSLRTGRGGTAEAAAATRLVLHRFHHHVMTLPPDTTIDRAAFFPRGTLGKLSRLKPADLLARADAVLDGFSAKTSAALPDGARWQAEITAARDRLDGALDGKYDARIDQRLAVDAQAAARERFLHVYNVIGKRLVYVVLAEIGRLDDYPRFFLDLQVHEGRPRTRRTRGGAPASEE
jgi:hypothetical protein